MTYRVSLLLLLFAVVVAPGTRAGQVESTAPGALSQPPAAQPAWAFDGPPPPVPPAVVSRDEQGRTTVRAVRVSAPLRIDGVLDEDLYSTVLPISGFVQVEPQQGAEASEKTDLWLSFDRDQVYLSARCWDTHPERRVATEMRRDNVQMFQGNDLVFFFLDTFYDRRNGVAFLVNSIGARNEGQVTGDQYNGDWNPVWDFAVGKFEGGWTVEVALPFKALRYRPGEAQVWGFNVLRTVRWKNEIAVMSPVPQGRGMNSARQSQFAATVVGLEAPPGSKNLEIKPYALSSLTSDTTAAVPVSNDPNGELGLDVKYGITQNLIADFTYNTDFAQVEADEQQVNLTRFSLFFPEKREFFLENQGTFSFGGAATTGSAGDTPILFYSRRIGLDASRTVPINGGGRLTGRIGRYNVGFLDIRTGNAGKTGPRPTDFSVVRVKRDVLRRSSIGLLFTNRTIGQGGGRANAALGVDSTFNFFSYLTINSYWARTHTEGVNGGDTSYRGQLDYSGDRYGVQLEHLVVGDHFNPEVGFVRRSDIQRSFGLLRFSPRPRSIPSVRRFSLTGSFAYLENGAGRVEGRERDGEFAVEFQNSDRLSLAYSGTYEFIPRPFRISSNVTVPVGGYQYDNLKLAFNRAPQHKVFASLSAEYGTFYSGHRTALSATQGRMALGPRFAVEPTYSVNWVDLAEGSFVTRLAGSRVIYAMSPRLFASALLQYNSSSNAVTTNARLRWEYRPGSELFVVYNDERDTRAPGFPELLTRSLIVKINRFLRF